MNQADPIEGQAGGSYERDFHAWATEQAALLRAGRLAEADVAHIAEEIETLGRAEKHDLFSTLCLKMSYACGRAVTVPSR